MRTSENNNNKKIWNNLLIADMQDIFFYSK